MRSLVRTSLTCVAVYAMLSACTSTGPVGTQKLASNSVAGTGTVAGTARAALMGTWLSCGPNDAITLTPITTQSEAYFAASFGNTQEGSIRYSSDPNSESTNNRALPKSVLSTNCMNGRYRFDEVPSGDYFLVSYLEDSRDAGGGIANRLPSSPSAFEAISMMQGVRVQSGKKQSVHLRPTNAVDSRNTTVAQARQNKQS